jgi:hypothetical protein
MSNKFNFAPNFIEASKVFIVLTYENENNKIYPMWAMFYQWPKIPTNFTYLNFLHYNGTNLSPMLILLQFPCFRPLFERNVNFDVKDLVCLVPFV